MLQPKRTKFRKQFKGRIHGFAKGGTDLNFGGFGLKAMEPERVKARQIEVGTDMSTGRPRVFAAGDITDYPGKVRLMAVGFGEAATAVNNIAVLLRPGEDVFPGHSSELPRAVGAGIGV